MLLTLGVGDKTLLCVEIWDRAAEITLKVGQYAFSYTTLGSQKVFTLK